jgi:hypothetical protein
VKKPFKNWRREKSLGKCFFVMGLILAHFQGLDNWDHGELFVGQVGGGQVRVKPSRKLA